MKTLFTFFVVLLISIHSISATDSEIVANWQLPIGNWFPNIAVPAEGIDAYPRSQALADSIPDFNPVTCDFDGVWSQIGSSNVIAKQIGNAASDAGGDDYKDAAFKVVYDANNMYVLVQYYDDDVTGNELIELMLAPYLKIDAISKITTIESAPYVRYLQFGAFKAVFTDIGFRDAMLVEFNSQGTGTVNNNGTTDLLATTLFMDNHTVSGSHIIKKIFTVSYEALKGVARPDFNPTFWRNIDGGKGISFEIKIYDFDTNDASNTDNPPKVVPAKYTWNSTSNDAYGVTYYAGRLAPKTVTGINSISSQSKIFGKIQNNNIQLNESANVRVYDSTGKLVKIIKNTTNIDLSNLCKGYYLIQANNESFKYVR